MLTTGKGVFPYLCVFAKALSKPVHSFMLAGCFIGN